MKWGIWHENLRERRYALASVVSMAQQYDTGEFITLISISERLGISKIYLEQVFSLLKRAELVISVMGSQGGYQLARAPKMITALDVLALWKLPFSTVRRIPCRKSAEIESAMRALVFEALDQSVSEALIRCTIEDLLAAAEQHKAAHAVCSIFNQITSLTAINRAAEPAADFYPAFQPLHQIGKQRGGKVPFSGVRQDDYDILACVLRPLGEFRCRPSAGARGDAHQQAFDGGDFARGGKASSFLTVMISSYTLVLSTAGTNPAPMP
jgi:Rrf2 family protein